MKDVWHLESVDWLSELSPEERLKLRESSELEEFDAGATVFEPTRTPHSVFLLERGRVRIYRLSQEGLETTFGYVAPGEVFGELPVFVDDGRESFAQAAEDSTVWRIPQASFQQLLEARPGIVFEITKQIGDRLKRIESRVENLVFRDVRSRVAHMLLELADRFGNAEEDGVLIEAELTQAELATLVGSARQSVNVSLGELTEEGLIGRRNRRILIRDPEALRRSLEPAAAAG